MSAAILFILACSISNCLGGRSPFLYGHIILRGPVIGILAGLHASTQGHSMLVSSLVGLWVAASMSNWAVWGWSEGFSAIDGRDSRAEARHPRLIAVINWITGYKPTQTLTEAQAKHFGCVYMAVRGSFQYPVYMGLAVIAINPASLIIGLGCVLQGACYRLLGFFKETDASVAYAELLEGALYGTLITVGLS